MKDPRPAPKTARESPQTEADRLAREKREAAALRENLRRRKDQARARDEVPAGKPQK